MMDFMCCIKILILFLIPYSIVIIKMLLHLLSYIAFNISHDICNAKLDKLNNNLDIKKSEKEAQKSEILKIRNTFYRINDWFDNHLRLSSRLWLAYCIISFIMAFCSIYGIISIKAEFNKEEEEFNIYQQFGNFEKLPMWQYDRVVVIKEAVEYNEAHFDLDNKPKFHYIEPELSKNLKPINVNKMLEKAGISEDVEEIIR